MTDAWPDDPFFSLIAAVAENGVIGQDGKMPWHLPGDLKRFKSLTQGKPVIMGRKTFESLGGPLVDRDNFVLSRDPSFTPLGAQAFTSLDIALWQASALSLKTDGETMIIGGSVIYRQTLAIAKRLYITEVHAKPEGDAFFPAIDPEVWQEVDRGIPAAGLRDQPSYSFVTYERC